MGRADYIKKSITVGPPLTRRKTTFFYNVVHMLHNTLSKSLTFDGSASRTQRAATEERSDSSESSDSFFPSLASSDQSSQRHSCVGGWHRARNSVTPSPSCWQRTRRNATRTSSVRNLAHFWQVCGLWKPLTAGLCGGKTTTQGVRFSATVINKTKKSMHMGRVIKELLA